MLGDILMVILIIVVIALIFLLILMHKRIEQLNRELERLSGRVSVTSTEIEVLTRNVEEFKKLKI